MELGIEAAPVDGMERHVVFARAGYAALVEAGNFEKWKLEIESLLADEPRRLALGAQARKDVSRLTWVKREEMVVERIGNLGW